MSPASYLTAPPRVAGRSIARLTEAHTPANATSQAKLKQSRLAIQAPIEPKDVTTIVGLIADLQRDTARIRELLEGELGQEEEIPEDDA